MEEVMMNPQRQSQRKQQAPNHLLPRLFKYSAIFSGISIASVLLLAGCSNGNDSAQNFYLAPEPIASGSSLGGVDIATGKLSRSESDLSSSTLSFSRNFASQGAGSAALGGWRHNFSSQLDGKGIPYSS
jgi:hypothetical protein